jgi:hypothetical protein
MYQNDDYYIVKQVIYSHALKNDATIGKRKAIGMGMVLLS